MRYIFGEAELVIPDNIEIKAYMVEDLSIDDYHDLGNIQKHGKDAVLSKSQLGDLDCPAKFKHAYVDGNAASDKDHFNVGNAAHTLALEPDLFDDRFYVLPEGLRRDARTDAFKACQVEAGKRKMITHNAHANLIGMSKALLKSTIAMSILEGAGKIESSIFWKDKESGLSLRTRPDLMRDDGLLVDLKTCVSADPMRFSKAAFDNKYDISVAMMTAGYEMLHAKKPDNVVFLCIEKEPPYVIEAYDSFRPWDPDDMSKFTYFDAGWFRYRNALRQFNECMETGIWPGYSRTITPMSVPGYAMKALENK